MRPLPLAGTSLLAAFVAAGGVHAAVLTLSPTEAEFNNSGGSFQLVNSDLTLGRVGVDNTDPGSSSSEDRYAFQFSLATLPTGTKVAQATLRLRDSQAASSIIGFGFAGNGTFSASSVTTAMPLFLVKAGTSLPVNYDVSVFVEELSAGVYAGFSLWQVPVGAKYGSFDTAQDYYAPQLTITYTEPSAFPAPEPASFALFGTGLAGFGLVGRRRRG